MSSPGGYVALLESSMQTVEEVNDRRDFALGFFKHPKAKTYAGNGPLPLSLHVLMRGTTGEKTDNMVARTGNGFTSPIEIEPRRK